MTTTTATADLDDLATRITQTLRETTATSTDGLRDGDGEPRAVVTPEGCYIPWNRFGRLLILTGEWLRTIGGPGPTVPVSDGPAAKFNWLGLLGAMLIAAGHYLQKQ